MTDRIIAYCQENIEFNIYPPEAGIAQITTNDSRLSGEELFLNTLGARTDHIADSVNACHACNGDIVNCVLKNGG